MKMKFFSVEISMADWGGPEVSRLALAAPTELSMERRDGATSIA
jgi:hypothetical protein